MLKRPFFALRCHLFGQDRGLIVKDIYQSRKQPIGITFTPSSRVYAISPPVRTISKSGSRSLICFSVLFFSAMRRLISRRCFAPSYISRLPSLYSISAYLPSSRFKNQLPVRKLHLYDARCPSLCCRCFATPLWSGNLYRTESFKSQFKSLVRYSIQIFYFLHIQRQNY